VEATGVKLIVQPIARDFELCARLGLVLVGGEKFGGRVVHAVLDGSPCARAGIVARDIVLAIDKTRWEAVRLLTFSDRRPSEIALQTFVARYFARQSITVRVPPEPYRPLQEIAQEAANVIAARPTPDTAPYRNPRFDDPLIRLMMARIAGRRRR
jgi:predicted metalloprotease with PDZ domain